MQALRVFMQNYETARIGQQFMSWLKFELAYQHHLTDFMGLESAFDSNDLPTHYLKNSPIYSVEDNDSIRLHLMETALLKGKAHYNYSELIKLSEVFLTNTSEIPSMLDQDDLVGKNQFFNLGVQFLNYSKLKNAQNEVHKEFKHFVDSGDTEQMFIKQKEWGEATTKAIDQYHALLDSAYTELGVKDQSYEFVSNKIKEWMATA